MEGRRLRSKKLNPILLDRQMRILPVIPTREKQPRVSRPLLILNLALPRQHGNSLGLRYRAKEIPTSRNQNPFTIVD